MKESLLVFSWDNVSSVEKNVCLLKYPQHLQQSLTYGKHSNILWMNVFWMNNVTYEK